MGSTTKKSATRTSSRSPRTFARGGELCVGGFVKRNKTGGCDSHCQRRYKGFAHQWESVGRCHPALKRSAAFASVEFILRTRPDVLLLQELSLNEIVRDMTVASSGAFLPCETMNGGYIDDFVFANKTAMDAYASIEPLRGEGFRTVTEARVGKMLTPFAPITGIVGHGILELPMIGKYVWAGSYLRVRRRHGRCVGKEAQRGACPGNMLPVFRQANYKVLKDYVRAHAPTTVDTEGRDVTAADVLLRLNAV